MRFSKYCPYLPPGNKEMRTLNTLYLYDEILQFNSNPTLLRTHSSAGNAVRTDGHQGAADTE